MVWSTAIAAQELPDLNAVWDSDEPTVFIEGVTLHYYGKLNPVGQKKVEATLQQATQTITRLKIASPGGAATPSIAISEALHMRDMEIVVVGKGCGSSCANYLFTPARNKTISSGSLIMWHQSCPENFPDKDAHYWERLLREKYESGNDPGFKFSIKDVDQITDPEEKRKKLDAIFKDMAELAVEETASFKAGHHRIFDGSGIDERIVCMADHVNLPKTGYAYTMSVRDMARFGVCNVDAPIDYAEKAAETLRNSEIRNNSGVIRLSDYPNFKPRYPVARCSTQAPD